MGGVIMIEELDMYTYEPYTEEDFESYVFCECGSVNLESMNKCHLCKKVLK